MSKVLPTPASNIQNLPSLHKAPTPQRVILKDREEDLRERLSVEKAAREEAKRKAEALKERMAYLEAMADELNETRARHGDFVARKTAQFESRRKPLGDHGMLTFAGPSFGVGNPEKPSHVGRNSRRTAFTTDFRGKHILGESEFVQKWRLQNRAEEIVAERDVVRAASTQPPSSPTAANRAATSMSSKSKQLSPAPTADGAAPRLRANGLPTLAFAKHCSSRRTRFYTDYEGKRIMMDACDWPEEHDFVLIGT
jgi:hypothetical protein